MTYSMFYRQHFSCGNTIMRVYIMCNKQNLTTSTCMLTTLLPVPDASYIIHNNIIMFSL